MLVLSVELVVVVTFVLQLVVVTFVMQRTEQGAVATGQCKQGVLGCRRTVEGGLGRIAARRKGRGVGESNRDRVGRRAPRGIRNVMLRPPSWRVW